MVKLKKISDVEWEIPKTGKMNVSGRIFASEKLLQLIKKDNTLQQVKNVAMLPGIIKASIALPDAHCGYGYSIGGVAAFDIDKGVISPGGVGFDINCGIRLLRTNLNLNEIKEKKKGILHSLFRTIPSGVGRGGKINITKKDLDDILKKGVEWCLEKNYATKQDLENCEDNGRLPNANPNDVSERAKKRGIGQLGTLGAGNHFIEIQTVEEIFDRDIAKIFGLKKDQIVIMIHSGSRGLGHQVASDYIQKMEDRYKWPEQDRQLVNAPIKSELGKRYLSAMSCAANFAFANRQLMTYLIRENLKHYFPNFKAELVYDVCHNVAKFEEHIIKGEKRKILVTRKGATRSFGIGRNELPLNYKKVGQPVLIPGSMGTSSYVLVGTNKAEQISFGSTAHGAGRVESRTNARKTIRGEDVKKQLEKQDIDIEAGSFKGISEEAPEAYKDIDEVVEVSHKAGIGNLVAKLKPIAVMKG